MDTEGSFLCSQETDIGNYPELDESSPHFQILFIYVPF
jgi:hypothetical protein